jgi:hypothetical protein
MKLSVHTKTYVMTISCAYIRMHCVVLFARTQAAQLIVQEEGLGALLQGAGATMAGYLWYGLTVSTQAKTKSSALTVVHRLSKIMSQH